MANKPINPSDNVALTLDTNFATTLDKETEQLVHREFTNVDQIFKLYEDVIKSVTGKTAKLIKTISDEGERISTYSIPADMEEAVRRKVNLMEKKYALAIGETSLLDVTSSPIYDIDFKKSVVGSKAFTSAKATATRMGGTATRIGTGNQVQFVLPLTEEDYTELLQSKTSFGTQLYNGYFQEAKQLSSRDTKINKQKEELQHKRAVTKTFGVVTATLSLIASITQKIFNAISNFAKETNANTNSSASTGLSTNQIRMFNLFDKAKGFNSGTGVGIVGGLTSSFINADHLNQKALDELAIATGIKGADLSMGIREGRYSGTDLLSLMLNRASSMASQGKNAFDENVGVKTAMASWTDRLDSIQAGIGAYFGRMMFDKQNNPMIKDTASWFNASSWYTNPAGISLEKQAYTDSLSAYVAEVTAQFKALADAFKGNWVDNLAKFMGWLSALGIVQKNVVAENKNTQILSASDQELIDTNNINSIIDNYKGYAESYLGTSETSNYYGSKGLKNKKEIIKMLKTGNLKELVYYFLAEDVRRGDISLPKGVSFEDFVESYYADVVKTISKGAMDDTTIEPAITELYGSASSLTSYLRREGGQVIPVLRALQKGNSLGKGATDTQKALYQILKDNVGFISRLKAYNLDDISDYFYDKDSKDGIDNFLSFMQSIDSASLQNIMSNMNKSKNDVWNNFSNYLWANSPYGDKGVPMLNSAPTQGKADINITIKNQAGESLNFEANVNGVPSGTMSGNGSYDIATSLQMQPTDN